MDGYIATDSGVEPFYLGTHMVNWLEQVSIPLFVSYRRLNTRKTFPTAREKWIQDSGAFSELSLNGAHTTSAKQYAMRSRVHMRAIGNMQYAAIQDYMCEPSMVAKTGLTIKEHISRTVQSYLTLMDIAPDVPWLPVLQGYCESDYMHCIDTYMSSGVKLDTLPLVGVGTMCKRQSTAEAALILDTINRQGISIHAFGFKIKGLSLVRRIITSADSMAWSFDARRKPPMNGHTHANCANCLEYALAWRNKVMIQ